jgi:DNA invertase Pin-like site-specific DNA recombinase
MKRSKQLRAARQSGVLQAVMYARVSSREQEQGYSVAAQQELLRSYATRKSITVVSEFLDIETAKTTGRPQFARMVAYLRSHPECRAILVEKTDRLYRNFKDFVTIDELQGEIHLVKENEILSEDSHSHQKLSHNMKVVMAKNYIDNLSEEVRKGMLTKASMGMYPSYAPLGYINTTLPDGRRMIVVDPILGPIVVRMFQWFATGEYTLKSLAKKAFAEGFRFRKSMNRIPTSTLHKMLRKRIYMGEFDYGGKTYQGIYEPLVSRVIWEQCQALLDRHREKKTRHVKHMFALSGIVQCGHCGCSMVGEIKKGRYVYFHCSGYRGKCPEPYVREEVLIGHFAERFRQLAIAPELVRWAEVETVTRAAREKADQEAHLDWLRAAFDRLQRRLEVLYDDRLDGRIDAGRYDEKARESELDQQHLREKIDACVASSASSPPPLDLRSCMRDIGDLFAAQARSEQRNLLSLVVREAVWSQGELRIAFQMPFEELQLLHSPTPLLPDSEGGMLAGALPGAGAPNDASNVGTS